MPSSIAVLLIDDHFSANMAFASCIEERAGFRVAGQAKTLGEAKRFVESAGAAAQEAEATQMAAAAPKTAHAFPGLVVLDIQLGAENGLDFLPFLKDFCKARQIPMPPVLVCSAFDDPFRVQTALSLGAAGYVPKNGSKADLLSAMDAALRGEVYVPPEHVARLNGISGKYMQLTKRELEVLTLAKQNKTTQQIADAMFVSKRTVEDHLGKIYIKVGVSSRVELMRL